jgi:hypothetical protein
MNLDKLIDKFIGEEKEDVKEVKYQNDFHLSKLAFKQGYNAKTQDLKSRKQELVEGIKELWQERIKEEFESRELLDVADKIVKDLNL